MSSCTTLSVFALLTATALQAQPAAQGYLDVYAAKIQPGKRTEFDAIARKWTAANRQHKGDYWLAYQVEYGEQNTVYFASTRNNYSAVDEAQKAFNGALKSSYGTAGMEKLLADGDRCLISSRSEIRTRRPDLSSNLPSDDSSLSTVVGKSRFLRIVIVRTRPGWGPDYEAQLRMLKQANEQQTPNRITTVSQSGVGEPLGIYYLTNFGDSIEALAPPKGLAMLLGEGGFREFSKRTQQTTIGTEVIIARWLPELSNAPPPVAAADPAFWNPKPPAPAKPKAEEKK